MNILILHRIPYHKIKYANGIDHRRHKVTYIGEASALDNLPDDLNCHKIQRPGNDNTADEVLEIVKSQSLGPFDLIISLSEYELIAAAKVRESLGVPGASVHATQLVRDKILMKQAVRESGLRVPGYVSCESLNEMTWTGKTVLKPRDGASSENIMIYESAEAAKKAILSQQTGIDKFSSKNYELEEFIAGEVLHIDGLVHGGEMICWLPSQYLGTCFDYAKGQPLGSVQMEPSQKLKLWSQKILQAVQIQNGSFHLEAFCNDEEIVFLEVANRVGGADVVDTFEMATGVHLPSAELAFMTGDIHIYDIRKHIRPSSSVFGWFVFPGHHLADGFAEIEGIDFVKHDSHLIRLNLLTDKMLPRKITYQSVEVPIAGVAKAKTSAELKKWMSELFSKLCVKSKYAECVGF